MVVLILNRDDEATRRYAVLLLLPLPELLLKDFPSQSHLALEEFLKGLC